MLNVLIATDNSYICDKIKHAIGDDYTFFITTKFEDTDTVIKRESLDLFFIDYESFGEDIKTLINDVSLTLLSSSAPIILLSENGARSFREEMYALGIKKLLIKPFFEDEIKNSFTTVYHETGDFARSHSTKTIKALVKLFNNEELAHIFKNRARTYCKTNYYSMQMTKDLVTLSKLLSIAVEDQDLDRLIAFIKTFDFAPELLEILNSKPSESKESAIIYSIYEQERVLTGLQKDKELEYGENITIYEDLLYRYSRDVFTITDFSDYKYISTVIQRRITDKFKSEDIEEFKNFFLEVLKYSILYSDGCILYCKSSDGDLPCVEIEPVNKRRNFLKISNPKFTLFKRKEDDRKFYTIEKIQEQENSKEAPVIEEAISEVEPEQVEETPAFEEEVVIETPPVVETPAFIEEKEEEHLSAIEYLNTADVDEEDIRILEELENEVFDIIDVIEYDDKPYSKIIIAINIFHRYANRLIYYVDFEEISNALIELAESIRENITEDLDKTKVLNGFTIIDGIAKNLKAWRHEIFVEKSADDIHFLDNSISADAKQLATFFLPDDAEEEEVDEDALEFF